MKRLQEFFAGRTLGIPSWAEKWTWRGPGYDDGWEDVDREDLEELHRLLGAYLSE